MVAWHAVIAVCAVIPNETSWTEPGTRSIPSACYTSKLLVSTSTTRASISKTHSSPAHQPIQGLYRQDFEESRHNCHAVGLVTQLHFPVQSSLVAMGSTAPVPASPSDLNPEPSDPSDRKEQHLPPKSYATAAHENLNGEQQQQATADQAVDGAVPSDSRTSKKKTKKSQKPQSSALKDEKPKSNAEQKQSQTPAQPPPKDVDAQDQPSSTSQKTHLVYERFQDHQGQEGLTSIENRRLLPRRPRRQPR